MKRHEGRGRLGLALIAALLGGLWALRSEAEPSLRTVVVAEASTNIGMALAPITSVPEALGYFRDEGLEVQIEGAAGTGPSLQMVMSNKADIGSGQPITLFQLRPKGAKVKAFYTFIRHNWFYPAVLESSSIRNLQDFKGKRIGVQSMGASMIPFMKLVLRDAGINPDEVTFVGVGGGAGAAALLAKKDVDVLGFWAPMYAVMENAGFKLRTFVNVRPISDLSFGVSFFAKDDWLRENPKVAIGFGRAIARATLFAMTNPEAAVRIHWKLYPQSKPAGVDEATAMKQALHEVQSSLSFMRIDNAPAREWGMTTRSEIEAYANVLKRAHLVEKGDLETPSDYFTSKFIGQINSFEEKRVIAQARSYKFQ